MADKPKKDLPKVPPFVFKGTSGKAAQEPVSQPRHPGRPPTRRNGQPSERGMLSVLILLITAVSLGIAMAGGAWIGVGVLQDGISNQVGLIARIIATGLAYMVGWIVGLFGIRVLGNLILPFFVKAYTWITLAGICVLQIAIISKLFKQAYSFQKFGMYVIMFGAGLLALIGLHLLIEKQNMVPFSFPMLAISLAHLYLIVFHYVFVPSEKVDYQYLWGDAIFFIITAIVSTLMLAHLGILAGIRDSIDQAFQNRTDHLVPPH
jgi:hypothetical protein